MGSQKSRTDSDEFGNFEGENTCSCSKSNKFIVSVDLFSCKMVNDKLHSAFDRVSKTIFSKNFVHSFLTSRYQCKNCGHFGNITFDFGREYGTRIRFGKYLNFLSLASERHRSNFCMCFVVVENYIHKSRAKFTSKQYNLMLNNCQDFALELWHWIVNGKLPPSKPLKLSSNDMSAYHENMGL